MRTHHIVSVIGLVAAAHAVVLFQPWPWLQALPDFSPTTPAYLQASWIPAALPAPESALPQAPSATPAVAKQPAPKHRRPVRPPPVAAPAPAPAAPLPTMATDSATASEDATAAVFSTPAQPTETEAINVASADAPAPDTLPTPNASGNGGNDAHSGDGMLPTVSASGPQLAVHSPQGHAVALQLPSDGSAIARHMDLRFKVEGFIKGMQYHAQAQLQWQTDGHRYQAHQSVSAFMLGSLEQHSEGLVTAQGFQPLRFDDRRLAKQRQVQFDWPQALAKFSPQRPDVPIGSGTQDRLSVFLQLAAMLQAMPDLRAPGTRIEVPTLGSRSLQIWAFTVQEMVQLQLPAGDMPALLVQRLPKAGSDETTQLWLSPELGYVPVRIHMQERNGDVMDLSLKARHL